VSGISGAHLDMFAKRCWVKKLAVIIDIMHHSGSRSEHRVCHVPCFVLWCSRDNDLYKYAAKQCEKRCRGWRDM